MGLSFRPVPDQVLIGWRERQLECHKKARHYSMLWEKRREYLDEYIAANASTFTSDGAKRDKVGGDWELQDAKDGWEWFSAEEMRMAAAIQTELMMRLEFPECWPTDTFAK